MCSSFVIMTSSVSSAQFAASTQGEPDVRGMPSGRREARKGERSGDRELKRREDFHGTRQARSTPLRAGSATTEFQFKEKAPGRFSPPGANTRVAPDRPGDAVLLCVVLYTVGSMRISRRGDLVAAASSQQSSISHFPQKKVRDREAAITSTRAGCAPQTKIVLSVQWSR